MIIYIYIYIERERERERGKCNKKFLKFDNNKIKSAYTQFPPCPSLLLSFEYTGSKILWYIGNGKISVPKQMPV